MADRRPPLPGSPPIPGKTHRYSKKHDSKLQNGSEEAYENRLLHVSFRRPDFSLSQAGADYVEIGISELNGHSREEILQRADALKASGLSCLAGNLLFPGGMPLVGEAVDREKTADYLSDVLDKAALLGIHTIVFGSGKARAVPEGYSREKTWEQLRSLCSQLIAPLCGKPGHRLLHRAAEPGRMQHSQYLLGISPAGPGGGQNQHSSAGGLVSF